MGPPDEKFDRLQVNSGHQRASAAQWQKEPRTILPSNTQGMQRFCVTEFDDVRHQTPVRCCALQERVR